MQIFHWNSSFYNNSSSQTLSKLGLTFMSYLFSNIYYQNYSILGISCWQSIYLFRADNRDSIVSCLISTFWALLIILERSSWLILFSSGLEEETFKRWEVRNNASLYSLLITIFFWRSSITSLVLITKLKISNKPRHQIRKYRKEETSYNRCHITHTFYKHLLCSDSPGTVDSALHLNYFKLTQG